MREGKLFRKVSDPAIGETYYGVCAFVCWQPSHQMLHGQAGFSVFLDSSLPSRLKGASASSTAEEAIFIILVTVSAATLACPSEGDAVSSAVGNAGPGCIAVLRLPRAPSPPAGASSS